ncbi:MAG: hypothetical protein AB8B96_20565 [Lysobacterales bacterium]
MNTEMINRIEILQTGELFVGVQGSGTPGYQYVYRDAAGVSWDEEKKGFKSTPMVDWGAAKWLEHIRSVVNSVGVSLILGKKISLVGVEKSELFED